MHGLTSRPIVPLVVSESSLSVFLRIARALHIVESNSFYDILALYTRVMPLYVVDVLASRRWPAWRNLV